MRVVEGGTEMRGPKPPVVELSAEERQGLEAVVRAHRTPQQLALRARIVLAAANGLNNTQLARQRGVEDDTVRLWRMRWRSVQAARSAEWSISVRVGGASRAGPPARLPAKQGCHGMP